MWYNYNSDKQIGMDKCKGVPNLRPCKTTKNYNEVKKWYAIPVEEKI